MVDVGFGFAFGWFGLDMSLGYLYFGCLCFLYLFT